MALWYLNGTGFFEILLMEEILHQLIWRNYHYLQGFIHLRWLFGISSINRMSVARWIMFYDFQAKCLVARLGVGVSLQHLQHITGQS